MLERAGVPSDLKDSDLKGPTEVLRVNLFKDYLTLCAYLSPFSICINVKEVFS